MAKLVRFLDRNVPQGIPIRLGAIPQPHKANQIVNMLMIQATNVAVVHDEQLCKKYQRSRDHGMRHQVAITHTANKMLRKIRFIRMRHEDSHTRHAELYYTKMKRVKRALSKTK